MKVDRVVLEPCFKSRIKSSHIVLVELVVLKSAEGSLRSFATGYRSHLLRCLSLSQAEFHPLAAEFETDSVDGFVSDQLQIRR